MTSTCNITPPDLPKSLRRWSRRKNYYLPFRYIEEDFRFAEFEERGVTDELKYIINHELDFKDRSIIMCYAYYQDYKITAKHFKVDTGTIRKEIKRIRAIIKSKLSDGLF